MITYTGCTDIITSAYLPVVPCVQHVHLTTARHIYIYIYKYFDLVKHNDPPTYSRNRVIFSPFTQSAVGRGAGLIGSIYLFEFPALNYKH